LQSEAYIAVLVRASVYGGFFNGGLRLPRKLRPSKFGIVANEMSEEAGKLELL